MIENPRTKTKHTFIVTIDAKTIASSKNDPVKIAQIQDVLFTHGRLSKANATIKNGEGLYYKKEIHI